MCQYLSARMWSPFIVAPRNVYVGHMVVLFLTFWEPFILILIMAPLFSIIESWFLFPCMLAKFFFSDFLYHSTQYFFYLKIVLCFWWVKILKSFLKYLFIICVSSEHYLFILLAHLLRSGCLIYKFVNSGC